MADRRVQMALGDFRFELGRSDYERMAQTLTWRWARQDVVGTTPVHQFVGEGARTLQLYGAVFASRQGTGVLDGLERAARQKKPLRLADAFGRFLGWWVITSLRLEARHLLEGTALEERYTLSLNWWGERP
ncbi:phage tail protein [Sulfurivirga sp.]|uniref:phage tail protein n=1 Tax=Sulfurivirga sp. TaxID=2614236 RepID=UPI0025F39D6E|nr:phage tail protein [Sulfurivirga sp.]